MARRCTGCAASSAKKASAQEAVETQVAVFQRTRSGFMEPRLMAKMASSTRLTHAPKAVAAGEARRAEGFEQDELQPDIDRDRVSEISIGVLVSPTAWKLATAERRRTIAMMPNP